MSAELLRQAATILRERANKATPGPWRVTAEGSEGSRIAPDCSDKRERSRFVGIMNGRVQPEDGWNAAYAAMMHPGVGLALAVVLDDAAEKHSNGGKEELVLHPEDPCEVCEEGGHEVDVCGGCYPMWEDVQAHSVYPCAEVRRLLPLARLILRVTE